MNPWEVVPLAVAAIVAGGVAIACGIAIAVGVVLGLGDRVRDRRAARRQRGR